MLIVGEVPGVMSNCRVVSARGFAVGTTAISRQSTSLGTLTKAIVMAEVRPVEPLSSGPSAPLGGFEQDMNTAGVAATTSTDRNSLVNRIVEPFLTRRYQRGGIASSVETLPVGSSPTEPRFIASCPTIPPTLMPARPPVIEMERTIDPITTNEGPGP